MRSGSSIILLLEDLYAFAAYIRLQPDGHIFWWYTNILAPVAHQKKNVCVCVCLIDSIITKTNVTENK